MKAIVFARVSSKDQEDNQSIPAQVRRLTEYTLRKNLVLEKTFQVTESSTKDNRKQFDEIIKYVKKSKEPIALITDTVDRLQRSFRETPLLDELRKQGKLELHFLRENLIINQQSNSSQLLQWDIGVLFASSYVRQLGDNVKRSQDECLRNGQWISKAPIGYKNITMPSGEKTIEIEPSIGPLIVKTFELYALGNNSFQTIALKMRESGLRTARNKTVSARTVELILKNTFYYGIMTVNGKEHKHKYLPLITKTLYNHVQQVIANHHKAPVHYAGKPILLRGLINCKNCGCTVTGDIKKQKYIYYSCNNSKRMCQKKWIREEKLLKTIVSYFDKIQLPNEKISEFVKFIQDWEKDKVEFHQQSTALATKRLKLTQERISKLIDMHLDGKIDSQIYHSKLQEYKQEQRELVEELNSYNRDTKTDIIAARELLELGNQAKEIFMSSKLVEKQELLNFFFSNFQLDNEKLDVELRQPYYTIAKSQDHTVWRHSLDTLRTFKWSNLKKKTIFYQKFLCGN